MFKSLIFLAIFLRLILMPISTHSDLFFINMFPNLLITDRIFDIASHVEKNFGSRNYSYYSPPTFYLFAFFQAIYSFASDTFSPWMTQLYNLELSGKEGQAVEFIKATQNPHILKDLFLAKVPYLIFDVASILVILKFVKKKLLKKNIVLLWLFNPVNIYTTYLMGQYDIIPTFLTLLGFYHLRKNPTLGILILGIAASFKNYAFLFIIPSALIYGETWTKRLKLLLVALIPYFIFLIPSLVSSPTQAIYQILPKAYLHYRKPLEGWALYSQTIKYAILITSYFLILLLSLTLKIKDKWLFSISTSLASILLVYAIAPRISFHYLLWALPLLILWIKNVRIAFIIILAQAFSLASYKLLTNHLQFGLFSPLNPDYFSKILPINNIFNQFMPYSLISGVGFLSFLFLNLFIVGKIIQYLLFKANVKLVKMHTDVP